MEKQNPIEKAYRNVERAKQVLIEKGEYDGELESYQNRRAVRSAGKLLWRAVEIMINAVFNVKNAQNPEPSIQDYEKAVSQRYPKLKVYSSANYDTLWGLMGDIGIQSKSICDIGFKSADEYITILAKLLPQQPNADATLPTQRAKLLTQQRPSRRTSQPSLQSA